MEVDHARVSLAVLTPDRADDPDTVKAVEEMLLEVQSTFHRVLHVEKTFRREDLERRARHRVGAQYGRRRDLARARNYLLQAALRDEEWVVWMDADVRDVPGNTVQQLMAAGRDVVVPNVVQKPGGHSYDVNSWAAKPLEERPPYTVIAHTPQLKAFAEEVAAACAPAKSAGDAARAVLEALELVVARDPAEVAAAAARALGEGVASACPAEVLRRHSYTRDVRDAVVGTASELHLEGYASPSLTLPLHKLRDRGSVVPLGGVGGAVLLVRGDAHREGLVFPPFPLHGRIETEGLAVMARSMGFSVAGMPGVEVVH